MEISKYIIQHQSKKSTHNSKAHNKCCNEGNEVIKFVSASIKKRNEYCELY